MGVTTSESVGRRQPRTFTRIDSAVVAAVPLARAALIEFARGAGALEETLEAVRLAVSEAVTNVVLHAYPGRPGRVYSSAWATSDQLVVHVADDGHGLHPGSRAAGLGLGLALIAQVCDEFELVDRSSGGTELQMGFDL